MKNYNYKLRGGLSFIFILFFFVSFSQAPDGYYADAEGKAGAQLKSALYNIIKGHKEFPYTSSSTDTWDILKEADRDPENPDNVLGIYSAFSMGGAAEYNNGQGWNREHVWAKSRGDFGTSQGAGTDCHHLRAADISTNSARNNRTFAECDVPYVDQSGVYNGPTDSYTSTTEFVWKPRDQVKGDVARMIFYMAVRYEGENGEPDLEVVDYILEASDKSPVHGRLTDLLQWHEEDPVDEEERRRNDVIFSYQENRNPFIDNPDFVESIWGDNSDGSNELPVVSLVSPTKDQTFNAGETISLEADATDPDGSISKVVFYEGDNELGESSNEPYTFNWENVMGGEYFLSAVAYDNENGSTQSDPIRILVGGEMLSSIEMETSRENGAFVATANISIEANGLNLEDVAVEVAWFNSDSSYYDRKLEYTTANGATFISKELEDEDFYIHIISVNKENYDWNKQNSVYESSITTFVTSNDQLISNSVKSLFYPNPFDSSGTLEINVDKYSKLYLSIYDAKGVKVMNTSYELSQGKNTIAIAEKLSSGIYSVQLRIGDKVETLKVMKE